MDCYLSVSFPAPVRRTEQDCSLIAILAVLGRVCVYTVWVGVCVDYIFSQESNLFLGLELCVTTCSGDIYRPHILQLILTIVSMLILDCESQKPAMNVYVHNSQNIHPGWSGTSFFRKIVVFRIIG